MTPQQKHTEVEITGRRIKAIERKPEQRFGRDKIDGTDLWNDFVKFCKEITPQEGYEFTGTEKKIQGYKRHAIAFIKKNKIRCYYYQTTDKDGSKSWTVIGE